MSPRARKILIGSGLAVIAFYVCILFVWALRPLTDSVPVGTDYTGKSPVLVSAEVTCHTLFEGGTGASKALPVLKKQPKGSPALGFQRGVCSAVHRDARIIFGLDTLASVGALAVIVVVYRRQSKGGASAVANAPVSALPA